jgi:cold-inducible RNA-binding protein
MRPIRITGNIFVTNLPAGFTDARLAEMFDAYGLVLFAYVARDVQTGTSRNFGLVDLAPSKAISRAVAELNGRRIDGRAITVRAADPDLALRHPPGAASKARLKGSDPEVTVGRPGQRALVVEHRAIGRRRPGDGPYGVDERRGEDQLP